jgi:hypothetical protein
MKTKAKNAWLSAAMAACLLAPSSNLLAQGQEPIDLGVGVGIPYGVLGANIEFYPTNNLSLSAGLGTTILGDTGYDLSLHYYFGREGDWTPRLSVHYGTNGVLETSYRRDHDDEYFYRWRDDEYETFEGISVGAGVKKLWGKHGIAFDVFYIASSDLFDRVDELEAKGFKVEHEGFGSERVTFALGYIFSF